MAIECRADGCIHARLNFGLIISPFRRSRGVASAGDLFIVTIVDRPAARTHSPPISSSDCPALHYGIARTLSIAPGTGDVRDSRVETRRIVHIAEVNRQRGLRMPLPPGLMLMSIARAVSDAGGARTPAPQTIVAREDLLTIPPDCCLRRRSEYSRRLSSRWIAELITQPMTIVLDCRLPGMDGTTSLGGRSG